MVAKRSFDENNPEPNNDHQALTTAEQIRQQIFNANSSLEDSEFLELWADDDCETNTLFVDQREPHEKPPPSTRIVKKIKAPVTNRVDKPTNPPSLKRIVESVNQQYKKPQLKSVVTKVRPKTSSSLPTGVHDHQFVRKQNNRTRHSSIEAQRKCVSPNQKFKRPKTSHTEFTVTSKQQQSTQTSFDCNNCLELISRLNAAERRVKDLENQLKELNGSCTKCTKRTQQRNIRNRVKQQKFKEFFRAYNQTE